MSFFQAHETLLFIISFVFYLFYGSFLQTLGDRVIEYHFSPKRKSTKNKWKKILLEPSHCKNCDHRLNFIELLPVLGYLLSYGKCRKCKSPIPIQFFLHEIFFFIYPLLILLLIKLPLKWQIFNLLIISTGYIIARIDWKIFLIPTPLLLVINIVSLGSNLVLPENFSTGPLAAGLVWFSLFYLLHLISPSSLGTGDIYLVAGFTFSLPTLFGIILPAVSSSFAMIYFFIKHHDKNWQQARKIRIPFGTFLFAGHLTLLLTSEYLSSGSI